LATSIDLDPKTVVIPEDRQRRAFTTEDIEPSIAKHGVLQPIIIRDGNVLVAGERRLTAALKLNLASIPCRDFGDLSPIERVEIEYEENVKRKDLSWQDHALATFKLHQIYASQSRDPESWPKEATAQKLNYSARHVSRLVDLGEALDEGDTALAKIDTISAAYTMFERRKKRDTNEAVQQLMETAKRVGPKPMIQVPVQVSDDEFSPEATQSEMFMAEVPTPESVPFRIVEADAIEFFRSYSGERFNFLHCDLPYGVELHGQANQSAFGEGYDSNPDIYWALCAAICDGWENVMLPSSHIMFWFSFMGNDGEGFYQQTIEYFETRLPQLKFQRNPLVWLKSDNRGILSDPKRGPRNICEFALLGATDDRYIVKPVANAYAAPTGKADAIHTNEKPIPLLNHFLSMLVDHNTRMIDPTAGSGSAIRSGEALGAELGLGLEFNPELARRAQSKLEQERSLRALAKKAIS